MREEHKIASRLIFFLVLLIAYCLKWKMTNTIAQSLVTFSSIFFGFYIASLAILHGSSYTKELYKFVDEKRKIRGIYILKEYLERINTCLISSISFVIIFMVLATSDSGGVLSINFLPSFILPWIEVTIDLKLLPSSFIFAMTALNIFYMKIIINVVIKIIGDEAKK